MGDFAHNTRYCVSKNFVIIKLQIFIFCEKGEEGIRKADKVFETIAMEEMMDTCTNFRNIFPYYNEHYWDVDSCTKIYFDSIRPLFTKTEMYEIINAIKTHCDERREEWYIKMQQIISKYNEEGTLH